MEKVLLEFYVEKVGGGLISFTLLSDKESKKKIVSDTNLLLMEAQKNKSTVLIETVKMNEKGVSCKSNVFIDGSQIVKWLPMSVVKEVAI